VIGGQKDKREARRWTRGRRDGRQRNNQPKQDNERVTR
jgi:hypothetical protein